MNESIKNKGETHDAITPLLKAMYLEFKELSKKNPAAAISKQKITIVNRLLTKLSAVLAKEESMEFLDMLDEDDVPQLSDVALILSQYVAAMDSFKAKYYGWNGYETTWHIK